MSHSEEAIQKTNNTGRHAVKREGETGSWATQAVKCMQSIREILFHCITVSIDGDGLIAPFKCFVCFHVLV